MFIDVRVSVNSDPWLIRTYVLDTSALGLGSKLSGNPKNSNGIVL